MPTTIEVNKQSVEALLGSGKSKPSTSDHMLGRMNR